MKIAVGCDHRGYPVKARVLPWLKGLGHVVTDFGAFSAGAVDYPDIAIPVAEAVAQARCDAGVLLCGNGAGMCIAANKIRGIRAAVVFDNFSARLVREQQHCNIICLAVDFSANHQAEQMLEEFLSARLAGGRHAERVRKLMEIERRQKESVEIRRPVPVEWSSLF